MKVKKIFLIFLIFNLFLLDFLSSLSLAQSFSEALKLNFILDKPSYQPQESFGVTLTFANNSSKSLKGLKVDLRILKSSLSKKTLFSRSFLKTLPKGSSSFKFSHKIFKFTRREGVYPLRVRVSLKGEVLTQKESSLVVVKPEGRPPLNLALVWNINHHPHFNPKGEFVDEKIQKGLKSEFQKLNSLNKYPGLKVNYNFTPLSLEQIFKISQGYRLLKKGKVKGVEKESKDSTGARKLLQEWQNLIKSGQIELLFSPYAYPSLTKLSKLGWEKDILFQIEEGERLFKKVFNNSLHKRGFYPPNFELEANSLEIIRRKLKAPYTILKRSLFYFPKEKNRYHPYRFKNEKGEEIILFFREEPPLNFENQEPEILSQNLIGYFAQAYLTRAQEPKVVVLAPEENLSSSFLNNFYSKLEKISWLKTVSLKEAKEMVSPLEVPLKFKKEKGEENHLESKYWKNLAKARGNFYLYLEVAEEPLLLRRRLLKDLLIAEGIASKDLSFIRDIKKKVKNEKAKIEFSEIKNITLASSRGKIPIAIQNQTSYKWRASLLVKGEGFSFPQGSSKEVTLELKENLFAFSVLVEEGTFPLKVILHHRGKVIKETTFQVKRASSFSWQLLLFLSLLLILFIFLLWLRFRRALSRK